MAEFDEMEMQEREQRQRMQDLSNRFPEYDNLDYGGLEEERNKLLSYDEQRPEKSKRLVYVHNLLKQLDKLEQTTQAETSFTDSNDGNTVRLTIY